MMKSNAIVINTGRGALINTRSLIEALKAHKIAGACLDVYEEEEGIFFTDQSNEGITDDVLARLTTFPNVILTSHQAFLTQEALHNIADVTTANIVCLRTSDRCENEV
jgi:D-lactate dehydrogenase